MGWSTSANWPGEAVKAGQIVKVKVLSADPKFKRIALCIKALQSPTTPPPKRQQQRPQPQAKPQPAMQDKLAALSNKFRTR